jgi:ribose 5-phosphate isomerase B
MNVFIGADHRGFELKNELIEYLQDQNVRVQDMGAYEHDPLDDFPQFSQKVANAILQDPEHNLGIVICGSAVGVSMAANRFKGVYCGLGFDADQVKSARQHDHINVLAVPSDYVDPEKAKQLVDIFLSTGTAREEKYLRRLAQIEEGAAK